MELDLIPLITVPLSKVSIVKHEFTEGDKAAIGPGESSDSNALILIKMKLVPLNNTEKEITHEISFVKSPGLDKELIAKQDLEFLAKADFTYDVDISILNEEEFIGGYKGRWTVPWNKLKNANKIIFHTVSISNPSEEEMFELMMTLEEKSKEVPLPEIT